MTLYGNNKRNTGRIRRELRLDVQTARDTKQAYSIDLSTGGLKIGGQMLMLAVGERVQVGVEIGGTKHTFSGEVARDDGMQHINRIGRDANAFFVRITDARFPEFMTSSFGR